MITRRALIAGTAAALAAGPAAIVEAAGPDPLPAFVAAWERHWREATALEDIRWRTAEEFREMGHDDTCAWVIGAKAWKTAAEIEAHYAPMIAAGLGMAEQSRDRYIVALEKKLEERERRGLDEVDERADAAWAAVDALQARILATPATSLEGLAAKARHALLGMLWPDFDPDDPRDYPPEARVLASIVEDAQRMARSVE